MLSANTIWIAFGCYMLFLVAVAAYVTLKDRRNKAKGSLLTASVPWPVLVMTYIASLMSTWVFFAGLPAPAPTTAADWATGSPR